MENTSNRDDSWAVAGLITARYGKLAMARAAGEAKRSRDPASRAIWYDVIANLRRGM